MTNVRSRWGAPGALLVFLMITGAGCVGGAKPSAPATPNEGEKSTYHTDNATGDVIVLRDAAGNTLSPTSTVPYSPERTCGSCHDVATITSGYHFQQGRTNADGSMRVSDGFNPLKPWLLSDGMYGKT